MNEPEHSDLASAQLLPAAEKTVNHNNDPSSAPDYGNQRTRNPHRLPSCLSLAAQIVIAIFGLIGLVTICTQTYTLLKHPDTSSDCNCGSNLSEAPSRNCTYDPLAAAWLPQRCIDHPLSSEFDRAGPGPNGAWSYYSDAQGRQEVNRSQVAEMIRPLQYTFVTREWHLVHCAFYWRKKYRSRETGVTVESRYDRLVHVEHCFTLVHSTVPWERIDTRFSVVLSSEVELPRRNTTTVPSVIEMAVNKTGGHETDY